MKNILISWIGENDLKTIEKKKPSGPVNALLTSEFASKFDEIHLLCNYEKGLLAQYARVMGFAENPKVNTYNIAMKDPSDYTAIYETVTEKMNAIAGKTDVEWHYHTSPGTSQMASIWVLLARTRYPGTLYQSWLDKKEEKDHVKIANFPFKLEAKYLPDIQKKTDKMLANHWSDMPEFKAIVHKSKLMEDLLQKAYNIGIHDVPVIILGETGTEKELIAHAIHAASGRRDKPMKAINCGALPEAIVDSTLFGWSKGAYTGAANEGKGIFMEADGGTIFLDEIGDLSPTVQVKLLRVFENGEVQRVGDGKTSRTDVRIVVATNKDIFKMVREGKFREDLFYRTNVASITLPPLRSREDDCVAIAEYFLEEINRNFAGHPSPEPYVNKGFSPEVRNFIKSYAWPGNIRELYHTIERACLWSKEAVLPLEGFRNSIISTSEKCAEGEIFFDELHPIDLDKELDGLRLKAIDKAMKLTGGVKTKAAKLLGYENYQTMDYYLKGK